MAKLSRCLFAFLGIFLVTTTGISVVEATQIPNPGFEEYEWETISGGGVCTGQGSSMYQPTEWESWFDYWCEVGKADYCAPCNWLTTTTSTTAYSGSRSLRINAIYRNMYFDGTAQMFIPHDGGPLPHKFKGYYQKIGGEDYAPAHHLDPQVVFVYGDVDLNELASVGTLASGPNVALAAVYAPNKEELYPPYGKTSEWTPFERNLRLEHIDPEIAEQVHTILIRFRHMASSVDDYAFVDDLSFEYYECELDWNGDRKVDQSDYLMGDPMGGFYAEWYIHTYYPGYYPTLFPGADPSRLDWDGNGIIEQADLMGPLDAGLESEGFYVQWYIYTYYPDYYPIFMPESASCIFDECVEDPGKMRPGSCGCGEPEVTTDVDGDGVIDCNDPCPLDNPDDPDGDGYCGNEPPTCTETVHNIGDASAFQWFTLGTYELVEGSIDVAMDSATGSATLLIGINRTPFVGDADFESSTIPSLYNSNEPGQYTVRLRNGEEGGDHGTTVTVTVCERT